MSAAERLAARELVAGYRPDLPILNGASLSVGEREIVTVIGPNGAGKSTLIKAVAGLITISAGTVMVCGEDITGRAPHRMVSAGISYVPQTGNIFTTLSVRQNLVLAAHTLVSRRDIRERVEQAFEQFPDLAAKQRDKGRTLSGGQRQMLALAMALMTRPGLVMLDEPTAGLAPRIVDDVLRRLRELADGGVAVLLVEQNAKAALAVSDRGYVLAEGRNQLDGPATSLLADPAVAEIYLGQRRKEVAV